MGVGVGGRPQGAAEGAGRGAGRACAPAPGRVNAAPEPGRGWGSRAGGVGLSAASPPLCNRCFGRVRQRQRAGCCREKIRRTPSGAGKISPSICAPAAPASGPALRQSAPPETPPPQSNPLTPARSRRPRLRGGGAPRAQAQAPGARERKGAPRATRRRRRRTLPAPRPPASAGLSRRGCGAPPRPHHSSP